MNKTININLGGFFFHIDEIAFQKLKRYLDSISRSLSDDPQGKNEIISDIEARISELLSEKITDARQVVNESDIDEVIKTTRRLCRCRRRLCKRRLQLSKKKNFFFWQKTI